MKANELRIGNWVEYFGKNKQIDGIKSMSISKGYAVEIISTDIHGNSTSEYSPLESLSLQPIPLTEEWLLKFGFHYIDKQSYCNKKQWLLQVTRGSNEDGSINRDGTWFDGIGDRSWLPNSNKPKTMVVSTLCRGNYVCGSVEYVHQLQNLYFALTGEELKLKS